MKQISKKDMNFIHEAIQASKQSQMLMKHGCVVSMNGKKIASGCNSYRNKFNQKSSSILFHKKQLCSCHAEMNALYKALKTMSVQKRPMVGHV